LPAIGAGGGVEDGKPVGIIGEAGDFFQEDGAGGRDERFGTEGSFATKDPEEVFLAKNMECEIGG
jgi:hypothetical protein